MLRTVGSSGKRRQCSTPVQRRRQAQAAYASNSRRFLDSVKSEDHNLAVFAIHHAKGALLRSVTDGTNVTHPQKTKGFSNIDLAAQVAVEVDDHEKLLEQVCGIIHDHQELSAALISRVEKGQAAHSAYA